MSPNRLVRSVKATDEKERSEDLATNSSILIMPSDNEYSE